jgi:hypothetical protein
MVLASGTHDALSECMDCSDPKGIDERSFRFYCDVLAFVETIPEGPKTKDLIRQLVSASGSIGGNREEARGRTLPFDR